MRFEFATATRIIFGADTLREVGPLTRELGRHALVVTGRDPARAQPLLAGLRAATLDVTTVGIAHEPTTTDITQAVALARAAGCDVVVGFGGGAAIDAAKAISALLTNPGELLDYLEVIGRARPLARPAAPCIAIPTTAGTGAEVTRNAVLASPEHRVKVSLRSVHLLPRVALIDPTLTYSLPRNVTAYTGLDALTQLIEPYVSSRAHPLTDALCLEGIRRVVRSLRRACDHGDEAAAREDMALASLYGGIALANAGLGAVHGFAGPIGGMFPAPHGAVCAALLAPVMTANISALNLRAPASPALARYAEIARILTGNAEATARDGAQWVRALVSNLQIPALGACGIAEADTAAIVEAAARASSMKANPITLTTGELTAILAEAI
ncbi:iron-containing alcohol dehydrogenase [Horticoccus sp. 23ND18S-11]|uniref:iron-containing alcohol dehydrogenase n=1 Tax=Horticoccus sp. 23ND18S-11 TaxID=3391832 RepID=UPI0039C9DD9C